MKSAEQQARDMLERLGVAGAQDFTAGDLVELANLIAASPCGPNCLRLRVEPRPRPTGLCPYCHAQQHAHDCPIFAADPTLAA